MVKLRSANFDMEVTFEGQDYYVLCTTYPDGSSVWGTVPANKQLIDMLQRAEIKIDVGVKLPKQLSEKKEDRPEPPNSSAVSSAKRRSKSMA